jgi:hypothetical protein
VILDFESLVLVAVPATPNLGLVYITPRISSVRTLDIFLCPNQYIEGNFESTWRRIIAYLNSLFPSQKSKFGVVTSLALVTI